MVLLIVPLGALVVGALWMLYMLPTIIAVERGSPDVKTIGLVNGLLGWSLIAWVAALVWALRDPRTADRE